MDLKHVIDKLPMSTYLLIQTKQGITVCGERNVLEKSAGYLLGAEVLDTIEENGQYRFVVDENINIPKYQRNRDKKTIPERPSIYTNPATYTSSRDDYALE